MKKYAILIAVFAAVFCVIMFATNPGPADQMPAPAELSVVVPDTDAAGWEKIKLGADQAAHDLNMEVRVVRSGEDPAKQEELLRREAEAADALVVWAVEDARVAEAIAELRQKLPVVVLGNAAMGDADTATVTGDEYEMGAALAAAIPAGERVIVTGIPEEYSGWLYETRFQGVKDGLDADGVQWGYYAEKPEGSLAALLGAWEKEGYGGVVCLDPALLERLAEAGGNLDLYGFGATDGLIAQLEAGNVSLLCVTNEYNEGYMSIRMAAALLDGKRSEREVATFIVADSETVYSKENQPLLFPIVQ